MTHVEVKELVAPYALGILEGEELAAIEEHLCSCAFCNSLAEEASVIADKLALSAPPVDPPVGGLTRLMRDIGELNEPVPEPVQLAARRKFGPSPKRRPIARERALGRFGWLRWRLPVPVALLVMFVLSLGSWNFFLMDHLRSERSEVDELSGRVAKQSEMLFLMTSEQTVSRPLVSTGFAPDAEVRLMLDPMGNKAMVMGRHLPQLTAGWIYQVWLSRNGSRSPVGQLAVDKLGNGEAPLVLPVPLKLYDAALITTEPESGVPLPLSTGVATGSL